MEKTPAWDGPVPEHVKGDFARVNEAWVAARRQVPGPEVLAEFETVAARRLAELRALPPERFDEVGWSPVGEVPYRVFMDVRVFDCWVHEQDIRRAVGRPGGRGGRGEAVTMARVVSLLPYVVGRKVAPPDGTTVVWDLAGPVPAGMGPSVAVGMAGGRARALDPVPADPTVRLSMDADVLCRLGCGRLGPSSALDGGQVAVAGDADLGRRILEAMNFLF